MALSVVKINAITVPRDRFAEFERRFRGQRHRVARPAEARELIEAVTGAVADTPVTYDRRLVRLQPVRVE